MNEFGAFLKGRREKKRISQVSLSTRLRQRGIHIDHSVISRWESGGRLPRDTNRTDLIFIGEILNLTAEEKDKLLILANLAPIRAEDEEEKKRKPEISETTVELTLRFNDYDRYQKAWWLKTTFYNPFVIETLSSQILIDNIQIRTSDPSVPYQLMLFEETPPENTTEWKEEDIIQMERTTQRVYTWGRGFPVRYVNREGVKQVYGGIGMEKKPIRFDMDEEEFMTYVCRSVRYEIRLQYRLSS